MAAQRQSSEPSTPLTQATSHPTPQSPPLLCSPGSWHVQEQVLPSHVFLAAEGAAAFQLSFGFCRSPANGEQHWEKAQRRKQVLKPFLCILSFLAKKRRITQELTLEPEGEIRADHEPSVLCPLKPEAIHSQYLNALSTYFTEKSQSFGWQTLLPFLHTHPPHMVP